MLKKLVVAIGHSLRSFACAVITGQAGVSLSKIVVAMLLGFVGLMFLMYFTPQLEGAIDTSNITNDFVAGLMGMAVWIVPIGGIVAIFYGVFKLFGKKGGD